MNEKVLSLASSQVRMDILRTLKSKGPLTYADLKSYSDVKKGKQSGIFAYHVRKLLRQSLVELDIPSKMYEITGHGIHIFNLAQKIRKS